MFPKVKPDLRERRLAEEQREAERHEAQRVLRESEERFHFLVDQVLTTQSSSRPRGTRQDVEYGAERIKGYRADEIIGQPFDRFYVPEDVIAGGRAGCCGGRPNRASPPTRDCACARTAHVSGRLWS